MGMLSFIHTLPLNLTFYNISYLSPCNIHKNFFDENCHDCKLEYAELKALDQSMIQDDKTAKKISNKSGGKKVYKEFSEERAKKLYEELLIHFLRTKSINEIEAAGRARKIIRNQCAIRGIEVWKWLKTK
jgi:hypothetical protein